LRPGNGRGDAGPIIFTLAGLPYEQRYCRGDWDEPKSEASRATIAVDDYVIERVVRLKSVEVVVRAGKASRCRGDPTPRGYEWPGPIRATDNL